MLGALAGAIALALPAAAAADVRLASHPPLIPSYDPSVSDYATWCEGAGGIDLAVEPSQGARVALGSRPTRTEPFRRRLSLAPGEAFTFTVREPDGRTRRHHVRCVPDDFPPWEAEVRGATEAEFYAIGARNHAILFDSNGVPVWWMEDLTFPLDVKLLRGKRIAWARFGGYPFGVDAQTGYTIRRLDGSIERTVPTVGSPPDAHELEEARDGGFYMWTYRPRDGVDLSPWQGPADATVVEGEVQRLSPDGRLLWTWNAGDHIPIPEIESWLELALVKPLDAGPIPLPDGRDAYDVYHANSIEETPGGDLLVSLRKTDAVYCIRRDTGEIVWKLGGTRHPRSLQVIGDPFGYGQLHGWRSVRNQLTRSDPEARLLFGGQHDARLAPDGTLTVFDNGLSAGRPPRVARYRIDERAGTATLLEQLSEPDLPISINSGSARKLPQGSWVISWGGNPLVTEVAPDGRRVLALRFLKAQSYRVDPILPGTLSRRELRAGMDAMARR